MKTNAVVVPSLNSSKQGLSSKDIAYAEVVLSPKNKNMNAVETKVLQTDQVIISKESQDKLLKENETNSLEKTSEFTEATEKENKETVITEIKRDEQVDASGEEAMSELDEVIAELEMKILELTVKVELLKVKGDEESLKEAEKLEIDLAMLKGLLEAKLKLKLDMAKTNIT